MGRNIKYTKKQIINEMRSIGITKLSRRVFDRNSSIGSATVSRYFGNWTNALRESGLSPGVKTGRPFKNKYDGRFTNKYSWLCLTGKMTRDMYINDNFATWKVFGRQHIISFRPISEKDLSFIEKYIPCSFHCFTIDDVELISKKFMVRRSKVPSIIVDLNNLNLSGKKYRGIRNRINRCEKEDLEIFNNYKSIEDVKQFVDRWSDHYSLKYFRDLSSKNIWFYEKNYHENCKSVFIYKNNELKAYGTLSPPICGVSVYIIGKAFYDPENFGIIGLSEYLDMKIYNLAKSLGANIVNVGGSFNRSLLEYKKKFAGTYELVEYEGKIE